ncbi:MAG: MerR family transcriptional regulator [Acidimicrobiia bacterium]
MVAGRLVSSEQVAAALHVGPATIRKYARSGRIPFVSTPGGHRRYDLDAVCEALEAGAAAVDLHVGLLPGTEYDDIGDVPPKAVIEVETELCGFGRAPATTGLTAHEWAVLLADDGLG